MILKFYVARDLRPLLWIKLKSVFNVLALHDNAAFSTGSFVSYIPTWQWERALLHLFRDTNHRRPRGWFSVTIDIRTSPQPLRLGRNPSKLRKHFHDRLSSRSSTRPCRTNVPFLRALLLVNRTKTEPLEVKRTIRAMRGDARVMGNKNVNRTKREWLRRVFAAWYANHGTEMEPMPLIGIETNRELTECRKLCTSQVQVPAPLLLARSAPLYSRYAIRSLLWRWLKQFIPFYTHRIRVSREQSNGEEKRGRREVTLESP